MRKKSKPQPVYQRYNLTKEEIAIVEEATK